MRENRKHGSEGGEGNLPDPYRAAAYVRPSVRAEWLTMCGVSASPCADRAAPKRALTAGRNMHRACPTAGSFAPAARLFRIGAEGTVRILIRDNDGPMIAAPVFLGEALHPWHQFRRVQHVVAVSRGQHGL